MNKENQPWWTSTSVESQHYRPYRSPRKADKIAKHLREIGEMKRDYAITKKSWRGIEVLRTLK